jgi:hypothetical protein
MHNDPELSGKYLGTISADFVKVADTLRKHLTKYVGRFEYLYFHFVKRNSLLANFAPP